ncbi:MAG: acyl-ACP--UDP-N-acetylglucosamine O-acyltransferase [Thermoanaerobaculaceae bacterium]|jgi:UDP-N-acetylglucosamine acyltransferase|nr:acyl-ACP--UDP-N-acetylglucosamine O-acyltransferase [Thermoanaerobaculaceae bacterium]
MPHVHPTAIVDPQAELGEYVEVGPYSVIEAGVTLGAGCQVGPFCRFQGPTTIGTGNRFMSHCSIGVQPQDLKFKGDPTRLEIGDNNFFREFVTLHRGTPGGGGVTRIGSHGLYMVGSHIAHDCQVGDNVIFANNGTLAGHVHVGNFATVGALTAVHQFCYVGEYAFLGGGTIATKDCLPFMKVVGSRPARCFGPNSIGLERKGFSEERRDAIKKAWRFLHSPKLTAAEAIARIESELTDAPDAMRLVEFMRASERGVILGRG